MAQYTVEAFQWTGTYYNAQYNTSHTATLDDNDGDFEGSGDGDETISIDGGSPSATTGQPYAIDVSFTDTGGGSHVETFNFFNTGGNWYFVAEPGSAFTVGATLGSYQSHTVGWEYSDIACFVRGTLIQTDHGPVPVEELRAGCNILTADGSFRPLRMAMSRVLQAEELQQNPKLKPIRIVAGALGNGLPKRDLLVSRQHRMLVSSTIAQRMFGTFDVLLAAVRLTDFPGIFIEPEIDGVEYFHLMFDRHEVIYAEGAPTESFYTGGQAMKTLTPEALEEFKHLFPELVEAGAQEQPARHIPNGKLQRKLVARHVKNNKPVLGDTAVSSIFALPEQPSAMMLEMA